MYKRQGGHRADIGGVHDAAARIDAESGKTVLFAQHGPVSYTHLDVYKRQPERRQTGISVPERPAEAQTGSHIENR